ncbi:PHP domain-containing protein [Oceanobacillus massiliensis]|uniref:PHP domain-containing protein n=1 Tax=Oceanobacillus massiliensis TaxID=1465765 RepID=UPI000289FF84|nr:PHP domain-containing protein [Oceanobacillus massiliensis]
MKADLHIHSNHSDGSSSTMEIMQSAREKGVTHLSIVDHDTVEGLPEAVRVGRSLGIKVISGIEISAYDFKRKRKVHILGYNYHLDAQHIRTVCEPLRKRRHRHSRWQMEQIQEAGYSIDRSRIEQQAQPSDTVYKQHIMDCLTKASYPSEEYQQLYKKLFKNDGAASGDIEYADAFKAVRAIVADGGLAVVAHPGQLDSYEIIPELVEAGLGGIERNHPDHTAQDHKRVEDLAREHDLVMTGGTDYHGRFGANVEIGDSVSPLNFLCE